MLRNPDGPRLACGRQRGQLFLCLPGSAVSIIARHQRAPEVRWDKVLLRSGALQRGGISLGSTRARSLVQMEAANDTTVAGSLVPSSARLGSAPPVPLHFFFPFGLTVCEKYVPCGLVGAVK